MVTRNSPGPAPIVFQTSAFDFRLQKYLDGKGFWTGVESISPAVAGNIFNIRIRNPAGSGKKVVVTRLLISSSVATSIDIDDIEADTVVNLANARIAYPLNRGQDAAIAVVSDMASTSGTGVGNPLSVDIPANDYREIIIGKVLDAGDQLDIDADNTAATTVYKYILEWYEE